jgi:outer membrane protein
MFKTLAPWITIAGAALALPAQAGVLLDVYDAARWRDPVLREARETRNAAIESRPQALAALLPSLSASAAVQRERYVLEAGDAAVDDPTDPAASVQDARFAATRHDYSLDLRQTLWSLEAFQRLQQSNYTVAEAEAGFLDAEQTLILRVAEAYFRVLATADTLAANRAERAAYAGLVDQAQKRLSAGLGARIGVSEADAFYSLTEQSVIDAELSLMDAQRALMQLTGRTLPVLPLRDDIPLLSPQPADAEAWLRAMRDDNPAVRAAWLQVGVAERGVAVVAGQYWPTLSLQGSMGRADLADDLGGDQRIDRIGLVAQWPLLQGGLVRSRQRAASAELRKTYAAYEGRVRQAERDTLAAYRGVLAGIRAIRAGQRAVAANQTALDASRNGVESGTRTEFDLLNAQNNYYAALRAYTQSRYDYLSNSLRLKAQAGRLSVDDLAAIDALVLADGAPVEAVIEVGAVH